MINLNSDRVHVDQHQGLWLTDTNGTMVNTRIDNITARTVLQVLRRSMRQPFDARITWTCRRTGYRAVLHIKSTRQDPWPVLVLHDRHTIKLDTTAMSRLQDELRRLGRLQTGKK